MLSKNIYFPQNDFEFKSFTSIIQNYFSQPIIFVEIGSRQGGSLLMTSMFLPTGSITISIDLPNGPWGFEGTENDLKNVADIIQSNGIETHVILGSSHDESTVNKLVTLLKGRKIDLLFVDGDHSHDGVLNDWNIYRNYLKRNSLVAFHDILKNEKLQSVQVWKLWERLRSEYNFIEFVSQYGIGLIKYIKS